MTGVARTPDHYPTRTDRAAQSPRRERVVWAGTRAGPLDAGALRDYEHDGLLTVEGLLDPGEVARFQAEVDRLCADPEVLADERAITEPGSGVLRSLFEVHAVSPVFAGLVADPRLLDRARQILGSEVYVHQSRINLKPGFGATGFYWHSDFETWHAEDGMPGMRALSISVSLTENTACNGPLMVMPGSHRAFVGCQGHTPEGHFRSSLRRQEIGTPSPAALTDLARRFGIRQMTGPAGTATIFDCNCMHGSGDNITPYPRSNLFVVYNSVDNKIGAPFRAEAGRPEFIASRAFDPVEPPATSAGGAAAQAGAGIPAQRDGYTVFDG